MPNEDTIKLLKECNSGVKMGVSSIGDVLDKVEDKKLRNILYENKTRHEQLGNETRDLLNKYHDSGKEPNIMAKSMSWMKTELETSFNPGDDTIADLITDGCNMGVKSLRKYLNQYPTAEDKVKEVTSNLINLEQQLATDIKDYL